MSARPQAKDLGIEHVREHRDRMPVRGCGSRQGPGDATPSQSCGDGGVCADVLGVVEVDEREPDRRAVDKQVQRGERGESKGDAAELGLRHFRDILLVRPAYRAYLK